MPVVADLAAFLALAPDLDFSKGPLEVEIKPASKKRSLSQNALAHVWYAEVAKHFDILPVADIKAPEAAKLAMKEMFLGRADIVVSPKLTIPDQLISTTKLSKGEMHEFMNRMYWWCVEQGLYLPLPEHSEYMKLRESQTA